MPEEILYREEQMGEMANILAPALRLEKPSNLFIYGKTGTGKTISVRYVLLSMSKVAVQNGLPLKCIYINCKLKRVADTEYRLIAQLCKEFSRKFLLLACPRTKFIIYFISYWINISR